MKAPIKPFRPFNFYKALGSSPECYTSIMTDLCSSLKPEMICFLLEMFVWGICLQAHMLIPKGSNAYTVVSLTLCISVYEHTYTCKAGDRDVGVTVEPGLVTRSKFCPLCVGRLGECVLG